MLTLFLEQDPAGTGATTPPSYLSALQELESPVNQDVLNLADTLTTPTEDSANEAGLRYLRASQEHEEWRVERSRDRLRLLAHQRDELDHRERLRRVMGRLSNSNSNGNDPQAAYGDRVPSQNSLYDWSPATNDDDDNDDDDELDQILAEIRRDQPNVHPEIIRDLARWQLDTDREARVRASHSSRLLHSAQPSQPPDSSLRSAAILQSARRHARFSARVRDRDHLPRSDRDSPSRQTEARDRFHNATENVRQAAMQRLSERRTSLDRERDHDMLARVDSYRRNYLDRSSTAPPPISPMLEQTIKYLAKIRHCQNVDDSLNCALDAGFLTKDYFCDEQADFVLDTFTLPPPTETSWLAPGAVLSGYQHATTVNSNIASSTPGTNTTLYRFRNNETMTSTLFEPASRPWLNYPNYPNNPPHRRSGAPPPIPEPSPSQTPQQDRWPVKVTIHAVDYSKMSLSATMEAYNVPSHPHSHQSVLSSSIAGTESQSARTSSITTYLEGEILDFNTHTLLTESFRSTPGNDATYWRKLPPFQKFTDEELVRRLTSRKWFEEVLGREWVLMRWKERCFVKSLNRSTADPVQPHTRTSSLQDLSVRPTPSMRGGASFHSSTTPSSMINSSLENRPYNTTTTSNYHYFPSSSHNSTEQGNISSDDSGCGLTISGFYYVCLRRSDGKLEGLYYDPQSSPYQCLKLESVRGGVFPAWGFR
jgi:hypothetical protein